MSDEKQRACAPFRTMIGGQALIEGIMMLGPEKKAVVVRRPDGGLEEQVENRVLIKDRHPILGTPFIRGVFNFGSSLANGVKALMFSAEFYPEDEEADETPSKFETWLEEKLGSEKVYSLIITLAMVLGLAFSIGLFILLPTAVVGALAWLAGEMPMWCRNLREGVMRVIIFTGYLILCSKTKDMHRVFQYHGAEHKTIFCYEAGLPLTVENVRKQPRHHPRCVSITYEINRWMGAHDNLLSRVFTAPGLWLQNWTTFEPDDSMIEVGIRSLELVLPSQKGKDAW